MGKRTYDEHCTVEGCDRKHYSKGLCRKHYVQKARIDNKIKEPVVPDSEEPLKPEEPKFIPPDEIKIGEPGKPPEGYVPVGGGHLGTGQPEFDKDGKMIKPSGGAYSFSFGSMQVALAWEQLSRLAPDAKPLELTPQQRIELDAAFAAAGITVNNPWIVIIGLTLPPTVLFIIMNYEQIKLNGEKMFKDMARFMSGLNKKKNLKDDEPSMLGP